MAGRIPTISAAIRFQVQLLNMWSSCLLASSTGEAKIYMNNVMENIEKYKISPSDMDAPVTAHVLVLQFFSRLVQELHPKVAEACKNGITLLQEKFEIEMIDQSEASPQVILAEIDILEYLFKSEWAKKHYENVYLQVQQFLDDLKSRTPTAA